MRQCTIICKGFTLVELLIVIGILGVLVAVLFAILDPVEQLKKSQDATAKNIGVEITNAVNRYYATHSDYPWNISASDGCTVPPATESLATGSDMTAFNGCLGILTENGELKSTFTKANLPSYVTSPTQSDVIVFFNTGGTLGDTTTVCYRPLSKNQKANTNETRYDNTGTAVGAGTGTFQCIKQ